VNEGTDHGGYGKQKCCQQRQRFVRAVQSSIDLPETRQHQRRGKDTDQRAPDHAPGWQHHHLLCIREKLDERFEPGVVVERYLACQQKHVAERVQRRAEQCEQSGDTKGRNELVHGVLALESGSLLPK
jgi:hypothetical protein